MKIKKLVNLTIARNKAVSDLCFAIVGDIKPGDKVTVYTDFHNLDAVFVEFEHSQEIPLLKIRYTYERCDDNRLELITVWDLIPRKIHKDMCRGIGI